MPLTDLVASVIVPVFNGERFLTAALESIAAQDYRPIEIIVVDDGSEDATGAIAQAFPRVRYLRHPHRGLAATRNAGVAAATGALVAFLDADDLWPAHKLSLQTRHLRDHPEVDYVVAHLRNFLEPGCEMPGWLKPEQLESDQLAFSTGTLLAHRRVFERVGVFDTRFPVGDDTDWFARVKEAGLVAAVLPDVLLRRRIHDRNHTTETLDVCRTAALGILKTALDRRRAAAPGSGAS